MPHAIEIRDLHKSYGKTHALKGISLTVKKGEILGLLGPNGAGKSTTTNILAGVLTKDSGKITILGKDFDTQLDEILPQMNVVSATTGLSRTLTIMQNLRVYGRIYGVKNLDKKIVELLGRFEIAHLAKKRARSLSTGQAARLLLCKGLINNPRVLLLDECTLGLDPDIAVKTRELILEIQREHQTTMLFTSHNMLEVEMLCNRIAFLNKGEILKLGSPQSLRKLIGRQTVEIHFTGSKRKLALFLDSKGVEATFPRSDLAVFELREIEDELARVVEPLFKQVRVRDIHIQKSKLEDVFIKIVRGELL